MFGERHKRQSGEPPNAEDQGSGVIISPDTRRPARLPPGQVRTYKWPVLDATGTPRIDLESWRISVGGLVEHPLSFSWAEFQELPRVRVFADFHCVTTWSRLGNLWEGVSTRELMGRAGISGEARFALVHGYDGDWSTNLPLEALLEEDALLALSHDGEPLTADHGGPVRLVVPRLYAWKSAKWVRRIELLAQDEAGYWERGGYHMRGDPWLEERFR